MGKKITRKVLAFTVLLSIVGLTNVFAQIIGTGVSAYHTIVINTDGVVYAWGMNTYGELGNNSTTDSYVPVAVNTTEGTSALYGKTIIQVAGGLYHSIALADDGTVYTWGYNDYGQLGDNSTTDRYVPVAVNTTDGISALYGKTIIQVAAGEYHSIALADDGTVYTWGFNAYGALGNNNTSNSSVPVAVNTTDGTSALYGKTITQVICGGYHSVALADDGTVYTWGLNNCGQLGDNSTTNSSVPVAVNITEGTSALYGKTIIEVAAGYNNSIALADDGTVYTWGQNNTGQLGDNSTTNRSVPVAVNTSEGTSALYGKTIIEVAAGYYHSIALANDGTVYAWGYNGLGQLGDNSTTNRSVPVAVNTTEGTSALYGKTITQVGCGCFHTVALANDGTVYTWGRNDYGQLGINSGITQSIVPVAVYQDDMGTLPVELTSFTASVINNVIELNWQTATEVNNYGFEIERFSSPLSPSQPLSGEVQKGWVVLSFVAGHGNSSSPKSYKFVDENPPAGNLEYRLKQIDTDGSSVYYGMTAAINNSVTGVDAEQEMPTEFSLSQNYPNPFNPSTTIRFGLPESGRVMLEVYNMLGQRVGVLLDDYLPAGYQEVIINGSEFSSGVYTYRISVKGERKSFISTKKFVLMK